MNEEKVYQILRELLQVNTELIEIGGGVREDGEILNKIFDMIVRKKVWPRPRELADIGVDLLKLSNRIWKVLTLLNGIMDELEEELPP